jgi:hypothetical protein
MSGNRLGWAVFVAWAAVGCGSAAKSTDTSVAGRGGAPTAVEASGGASGRGGSELSAVAGAGGGAALGTAGASSISAGLQRLAEAFCTTARACCKSDPMDLLATCEKSIVSGSPLRWVTDGSVALDESKLGGCIAALGSASPSCARGPIDAACRGVIASLGRVGDACLFSHGIYACGADGPGSSCVEETSGSTSGVCRKVVHAASGQACTFECTNADGCPTTYAVTPLGETFTGCFESDGLRCALGVETPALCLPPLTRGAVCRLGSECRLGDECRSEANAQTTCQAPLPHDESLFGSGFGDNSCFAQFPTFDGNLL